MKRIQGKFSTILSLLTGVLMLAVPAFASSDITLRFTTWDGDAALRVIRKLVTTYEESHPGIHVQVESIGDYNLYHQKMMIEYAADDAPDVAMMDPGHFQALAIRKALLPLNQFYNQTPGFNISAYYKPIVDAHSLNGNLYVLPRDIAPMGLIYYNKKMFRDKGIPYPDGSWTWDYKERPELKEKDFWWVVDQLTQKDPSGKTKTYGYTADQDAFFLESLAYSSGNRYVNDPKNPTKILTGGEGWIKAGDLMQDIEYKKKWAPSANLVNNAFQSSAYQLFIQGKTAMFQSGIWQVPQIRKNMGPNDKGFFDWDIAPFPMHVGSTLAIGTGGSGYAIFSTTKHPLEAWKLASYMAGPPGMKAMAEAGIAQPAIRAVALSDAWLPGPNTPLDQQYPHSRIVTDQEVPDVVFPPTSPLWPDVSGIFTSKMDNFYNGIEPASKVFPEATRLAQSRLDFLRQQENLPKFNWLIGVGIGLVVVLGLISWVYFPEIGKRHTLKQKRENRSAYKFIAPWIIGTICFTLGPMVLSLLMSTMDWDMILPARSRGLGNFHEAFFQDPRFWVSLRVTFIYTIVRVPASLVLSLLLALLLNAKVRGVALYRACFYMPSLASGVAAALIWKRMFNPDDGIINSILYNPVVEKFTHIGSMLSNYAQTPNSHVNWLGNDHTALASFILMSIWGVGGSTIILLAGLQGIPDMYYEAATVDGATQFTKFRNITVPLVTPAIFFTLITGLIGAFQNFTDVYVVTGGTGSPNNSTLLYMLNLYIQAFQNFRFGYVAALSWVLFVIILLVTLLQLKTSKWVYYESDLKS